MLVAESICRIAVLVSGGGTNLQALIDAQDRGEIKGGRISGKRDCAGCTNLCAL